MLLIFVINGVEKITGNLLKNARNRVTYEGQRVDYDWSARHDEESILNTLQWKEEWWKRNMFGDNNSKSLQRQEKTYDFKKNNENIRNNYQIIKIECRNENLNTHNYNRHYYKLENDLIPHKITKT